MVPQLGTIARVIDKVSGSKIWYQKWCASSSVDIGTIETYS
jgi:hypothetical protein